MKIFNPEDRLIITRTSNPEGPQQLVIKAEDVVVFIEEIQDRFTKNITDSVELARVKFLENTDKIIENENNNSEEHDELKVSIDKNTLDIVQNYDKNVIEDNRIDKLEANENDLGIYGYAWGEFVNDESPVTVSKGFMVGLNGDGEVEYERFRNIKTLLFNKTDAEGGDPRTFFNLYPSDTIELVWVNTEFDDIIGEARGTFRVLFDQPLTAKDQEKSDHFRVDVELVNGRGDVQPTRNDEDEVINTGIPVYYKRPTKTRYMRCGVYPSQYIDESVHTDDLIEALEPIGSILYWPTTDNIPEGYLVCDGTSFRSLEGEAAYIGEDFTKLKRFLGDNLPDFRGRSTPGALINQNTNKSRNSINIGAINQKLYLKSSLFELDSENTLHQHKVEVNKAGSHTHKFADKSTGAGGNQVQAHVMNLNDQTKAKTSDHTGHTHASNMSKVDNHLHPVFLNITDSYDLTIVKEEGEVRPAGFGMTVLIKYKHVILD